MSGHDEVDNCTPVLSARKQILSSSTTRKSTRRYTPYGGTPKTQQLKGEMLFHTRIKQLTNKNIVKK